MGERQKAPQEGRIEEPGAEVREAVPEELTERCRAGKSCLAKTTACARASRQETASTFKELEEAVSPAYT